MNRGYLIIMTDNAHGKGHTFEEALAEARSRQREPSRKAEVFTFDVEGPIDLNEIEVMPRGSVLYPSHYKMDAYIHSFKGLRANTA